MAKTILKDIEANSDVPFMRGVLTYSLQDAGLSFEDAYSLASDIRSQLAGVAEITTAELRQMVVKRLADAGHADLVDAYQSPAVAPARIEVRDGTGASEAFSRAHHQFFLESCGIPAGAAEPITADIYNDLLYHGVRSIDGSDLGFLTYHRLKRDLGKPPAQRYLLWSEFRRSGRPLLLLIGGTVGSGKSTLATEIAHRIGIIRIQPTDMLREVMRFMIPERLVPALHTSTFSAWTALAGPQRDADENRRLIDGYCRQAELVSVPCDAVIGRALRERVSLILEGIHFTPSHFERIPRNDDAIFVPIILAIRKESDLRKRLQGRKTSAPQRRSERYLDNFEKIWHIQSYLLAEADRMNVQIIPNGDKEIAIQQSLATITDTLAQTFSGTPEAVFDNPTLPFK